MQTASPAVLDEFLSRFTSQVGAGFGLIQGDVQTTLGLLIVISIGISGLFWALDEAQNVPAALIRKILLFGFFAWLISSWHDLTLTVVKGFAALGLKAGGGSMTLADFMNAPSKIVRGGLDMAFDLLRYIGRLAGEGLGVGFFQHIDAILVTGIVAIGVILAFVVLGVEIVATIIEFYIVTLISFVLVPFGILTQTAFLAERAIAYVPSVGVKVMALALVVSIGESIFTSYIVSPEPTWDESCGLLVAAIVFLMLALKIPAIAAAQITGGPQLSAGSAASSVVGIAATVGGLALAGRLATGAGAAASAATSASKLPPSGGASGLSSANASSGASSGSPRGGSGPSAPSSAPPSAPSDPGAGAEASQGASSDGGDPPAAGADGGPASRPRTWTPRRWRSAAAPKSSRPPEGDGPASPASAGPKLPNDEPDASA